MQKNILYIAVLVIIGVGISTASANHSWNSYHWAATSTPITLELGDNVTSQWDGHLATASSDWSLSSVLNTVVKPGKTNSKNCRPTQGRVEVCNNSYGQNGWLGIAQIWINGNHIVQGVVKMNDTYFSSPNYNTDAWRDLVVCQEVGHTFGLAHQDESFGNANLNTCMDYTSSPESNRHPNAHDYEQLEAMYGHNDGFSTIISTDGGDTGGGGHGKNKNRGNAPVSVGGDLDLNDPSAWGEMVHSDAEGRTATFVRALDDGTEVHTHVTWAE